MQHQVGKAVAFPAIRGTNEALQNQVQGLRDSLQTKKSQFLMDLDWNRLAHGREYAFVLHSAQRLHPLTMGVGRELDL